MKLVGRIAKTSLRGVETPAQRRPQSMRQEEPLKARENRDEAGIIVSREPPLGVQVSALPLAQTSPREHGQEESARGAPVTRCSLQRLATAIGLCLLHDAVPLLGRDQTGRPPSQRTGFCVAFGMTSR